MKRSLFKKGISVTLSVVMLLSCLVFSVPQAAAAATTYSYTLQMITENNADCNDNGHPVLELYGKPLNGTGGEELIHQVELDYDYVQKKETYTYTGSGNKFPTRISLTIDFDGGGWRKWQGKFKISVNGTYVLNDTSNRELSGANLFSHEKKNMSVDVSKGNYPAIQSCKFIKKPPATIQIPKAGEAPAQYEVSSEMVDQFGVIWYEQPSIYLDNFVSGVTVADGVLSVSSGANSADGSDTTIKLNTTYLNFNDTVTTKLINASYTYEFQDEAGNRISGGTLKAGQTIPKPADLSKASDAANHYLFGGWTPSDSRLSKDTVFKPVFTAEAHRFLSYTSDRNATCTKDGTKTAVCTCGETKTVADEGSALGHSYTYAITKEAGCTEKGTITYTCIRGDHTYTVDIEPSGHDYVKQTVPATCEAQGYDVYTCSKCDDTYTDNYTDALGHRWNSGTVKTAAGCTTEGEKVYTCSRCNDTYTEQIAALGHNTKTWTIESKATCTQDGSRFSTCSRCKEVVREVIPAFGHSWTGWEESEAPACEKAGKLSRTCMICATQEDKDITPLGHDMVEQVKAPEDGSEGMLYYVCSRNCGKYATCEVQADGTKTVGEVCEYEALAEHTTDIPTTSFNTYYRAESKFNYVNRGASLRIDTNGDADKQAMRFCSSMLMPQGVEVTDFGYIYTRADYFKNLKKFVLDGEHVASVSVKNGKYSTFQTPAGEVKTFNIVINVNAENWSYDYIARPYIVYSFAGQTFSVYDAMYAARSVDYVAGKIMDSPTETQFVKDYIKAKIIDR